MKLVFINGAEVGKVFDAKTDQVRIGREVDNDIAILAGGLSRYHATLKKENGVWIVTDLNSTNGTKVNGIKIEVPTPLHNEDFCTLGDQIFKFQDTPAVQQDPQAPVFNFANTATPDATVKISPMPQTPTSSPEAPILNFGLSDEPGTTLKVSPPASSSQTEASKEVPDIDKLRTQGLFGKADDESLPESDIDPAILAKNKKRNNFLIIAVAVLAILLALLVLVVVKKVNEVELSNQNARKNIATRVAKKGQPLTVYFERQKVENGNVFRVQFRLEQGIVASMRVIDLASNYVMENNYIPLVTTDTKIKEEPIWQHRKIALERLQRVIERSKFMSSNFANLPPTPASNYCHLFIALGQNLQNFSEYADVSSLPSNVSEIEAAIAQFTEEIYGRSLMRSPTEIMAQAENDFKLGHDAFINSSASPAEHLKAIRYLSRVVTALSDFKTKSEIFTEARKELEIAKDKKKTEVKKLKDYVRALNVERRYSEAIEQQKILMEYLDPSSTDEDEMLEIRKAKNDLSVLVEQFRARQKGY